MRKLILLFIAFWTFELGAQVDSMQINGDYYYIYPFQQDVIFSSDYWAIINDEDFFTDYRNYFMEFEESFAFTAEDFKTDNEAKLDKLNKKLKGRWKYYRKKGNIHSSPRRFIKAARKNPEELITVAYMMDKEVIPPFQSIPDGKYVMLFEDFCLVDDKGECQPQSNRVSAYFDIKNNALDGYTIWLDVKGDTIKEGKFVNGLKEGKWLFKPYSTLGSNRVSKWEIKELISYGHFFRDTSIVQINFHRGAYDGEYSIIGSQKYGLFGQENVKGYYSMGSTSGTWEVRDRSNDSLLMKLTFADASKIGHSPVIRNGLFYTYLSYYEELEFDFSPKKYQLMKPPINLFEINFEDNSDLQLVEEEFNSLDLEHTYAYTSYYSQNKYPKRIKDRSNFYAIYQNIILLTDPNTEKIETRGFFIDSLGAHFNYDGDYEIYYPNGQLFTKYEFANGELTKEGDLLWDNGIVHDRIEFVADSNHYLRSIYDYNGKLYEQMVYDSLGDYKYKIEEKKVIEKYFIDGMEVKRQRAHLGYNDYDINHDEYYYYADHLMDSIITTPQILSKGWQTFKDTTVLYEWIIDPIEKKSIYKAYGYDGSIKIDEEVTFSDDYSSFTGTSNLYLGNYRIERIMSGALLEFENDTMGMRHMYFEYSHYDVVTDELLYLNDELYTGDVKFTLGKSFDIGTKKLHVKLGDFSGTKRFRKEIYRFMHNKKIKHDDLFKFGSLSTATSIASNTYQTLTTQEVYDQFAFGSPYSDYIFDSGNDDYNRAEMYSIKGNMVGGKAEGLWTAQTKSGKILKEIAFHDGLATGELNEYKIHSRVSKYYRERAELPLPKRRTYYLSRTANFSNGKADGMMTNYYWDGRIESQGGFTEGMRNGQFVEYHPLAYTETGFQDGVLDGYMRTFLTLPKKDTTMLFELNFQHGLLNGESKAFHTNGKLANRCFFLDNEPIEDYVAYDTLGFRYHYVKFQFGFPVEEKIWEENQLSLRYQLDWEDSVFFDISEITNTMSLDRLVYRMGYDQTTLNREYYGRKRLINKTGLEYHMTKFYPNDTVARDGHIIDGKKIGHWDFYDYYGEHLYSAEYFDTLIRLNDSIAFIAKGILTELDSLGNEMFKAYIIEKMEKYDCAHTDHYEIRQFYTIWERDTTEHRMNGVVRNYYDNGVLQSEGTMENGLPSGIWKYYDPFGKLNLMGNYLLGKRNGRWIAGDLSKKKYLGEICLNPDLPDLEKEMEYRENLLDIEIINYQLGKLINKQYYDIDMNGFKMREGNSSNATEEMQNEIKSH